MNSQAVAQTLVVPFAQAPISLPLRNLLCTFALTLIALAAAGALWGTTGYEMLIVGMGWPHIILGFLFYFGNVLRGAGKARTTFVFLALLTLGLWTTHYFYTITGFIAIYFTYHVFRDEVYIYYQTRARHRLKETIYVAGFVPFILLMFLVTDPRPQHYRQDLRRVDLESGKLSVTGWTLISFEPISYSANKKFYFYIQTPSAPDAEAVTTTATTKEAYEDGEIRISDRPTPIAADLIFRPDYADQPKGPPAELPTTNKEIPISLNGGHRVGQTFTATRNNLAGIWIPTKAAGAGRATNYVFHLTADTSRPLPPLSPLLNRLRVILLVTLLSIVLWKAIPQFKRNRAFWLYFALFLAIFALLQKVIRMGGSQYELPIMFQLVVVFHYWSWYVFSFDKLHATAGPPPSFAATSYDRLLSSLRSLPNFLTLVIILNIISFGGVIWYSKLHAPAVTRYVFDYSYFLYFLVFHVTFSLAPKLQRHRRPSLGQSSPSPAV